MALPGGPSGGPGMLTELHQRRLDAVVAALIDCRARRVMDLGCGSGALLARLVAEPCFEQILALESSATALQVVRSEILSDPALTPGRVRLVHGSWTEPHRDCQGYQAAALVETIEHLDPRDLSRMENTVFGAYGLSTIVLTTPNGDYNALIGLGAGEFRDPDHRFEWGRAKFRRWCRGLAGRHGYHVRFAGIGDEDPEHGAPTQMAVFSAEP